MRGRPYLAHFGVVGDLPGGMAQVVNEYLSWRIDGVSMRAIATTRGPRDWKAPLLWVRAAVIICTARLWGIGALVLHVSQGGSFVREGSLVVLARTLRLPVAVHIHGSSFVAWSARHRSLVRTILSRADVVFVLTEDTAQSVEGILEPSRIPRIVRVPNLVAVPPESVEKSRVILFAGEVGVRKGADILLKAWSSLESATRVGWRLVVAGPMRLDDAFLWDVRVDSAVEFLGSVPRREVLRLAGRAWIAVLPSTAEALPMFLVEAMARSCAVIGTPVGSVEELVSGAGLVVPVGNVESLATAMKYLMDDTDARDRLSSAARQRIVERYSIEANGRDLIDEWRWLLRNRKVSRA